MYLGYKAFSGASSLTSIIIPDSVTSIGDGAFRKANNLKSITLPFVGGSRSTSTTVQSSDSASKYLFGYIFGSISSFNNAISTTNQVYQGQDIRGDNRYEHYCIPSSLKRITITDASGISANAFYRMRNVTSINLNEGIEFIGDNAFFESFFGTLKCETIYLQKVKSLSDLIRTIDEVYLLV